MKTKMMIGSFVATLITFQGLAQRGENDDMYFNAKDREKLATTASVNDKIDSDYKAFKKKHFDKDKTEVAEVEETNPTDSYSARNVNPEYISRANSEQASEDEQNYYLEDYSPNTYDSYSSNNYNNYNNSWSNNNNWNYRNSWYGQSAWNSYSPYYGGYCDPWMSPYYGGMNPYYGGSGLSVTMSYMWGNGWGNSYYNPYGYSSYYSPYYPSSGYYYGGSESSRANYGKRPSRHSAVVVPTPRTTQRLSSSTNSAPTNRTRQSSDEYYVKPSKRMSTFENLNETTTRERYTRPTNSVDNSRTRGSYNNNARENRPTYSPPSRSSSPERSAPPRSSSSSSSRKRD